MSGFSSRLWSSALVGLSFGRLGRPEPDLPMSLRHPVEKPCVSGRDAPDLSGKRLELLKDMVPTCAIVAVIWNPTNSAVRELRRAR